MEIDYQSMGKRIKHFREKNGLSQYDLAERTGISRSYLSRIESGQYSLSLDYLVLIANELEVSIDDLLKDSLATADKKNSEVETILLSCSPEEERILTKNMKDLRETIRPYNIK
ncbi:MAG: helix-turn-helix transcriptional regulator [Spirochaetales bacterium]|nr:helix-turn-helix transcriptional regulator [Spirochaetales bacterium]